MARNPFFTPDAEAAARFAHYLDFIRKAGSSIGAVIEIVAEGVPVGWGAPIYGKLDSELASALMSINAVKGVEIGDGFAVAELTGEDNADEMRIGADGRPTFLSNHAGGVLGGISTGQTIVARFAVKPTSSILAPRRTVTQAGEETEIVTRGRHDPCVGIRAVPVGEAMVQACWRMLSFGTGGRWGDRYGRGLEAGDLGLHKWCSGDFDTAASSPGDYVRVLTETTGLPVPEPATWTMLLLGFVGLGVAGSASRDCRTS